MTEQYEHRFHYLWSTFFGYVRQFIPLAPSSNLATRKIESFSLFERLLDGNMGAQSQVLSASVSSTRPDADHSNLPHETHQGIESLFTTSIWVSGPWANKDDPTVTGHLSD
jgi:hypothetical protein